MEQPDINTTSTGKGWIHRGLAQIFNKTMVLSRHRHAVKALAGVSFIESSIFPIPPDIMLIPMVLAERRRAFLFATICTLASVLGGLLGYFIGYGLWETIGEPLMTMYGYNETFARFAEDYNHWGAWIVFTAGITPFPYKVITIASGLSHLDLTVFLIASVLSRGLRFFIIAGLLYKFGEPIRAFLERHLGKLGILFVVSLFGGFLFIKWFI